MAGDECARAGLLGPSTGVPGEGGVERERERERFRVRFGQEGNGPIRT